MLSARQLFALGIIVALTVPGVALAQMAPGQPGLGSPDMREMMKGKHPQGVTPMAAPRASMAIPTMPGQDSFGAIQEIVRILEADPNTDWSKVDLEALRQHLIDMNESKPMQPRSGLTAAWRSQ
jgi:hypothetical protein